MTAPGRYGTAFPLIAPYEVFETARRRADDRCGERPPLRASSASAIGAARARRRPALPHEPRPARAPRGAPAADPRAARSAAVGALARARSQGIPVAPVQDLAQVGDPPADARRRDRAGARRASSRSRRRSRSTASSARAPASAAAARRALGRGARGARLLRRRRSHGSPSERRASVESREMIDLPQKIVCVGLNYRDHAEEQGVDLPERPLLFAKWPNTLIAAGRADPHPGDLAERRLRGGARRRHRAPRERCRRRRRARLRRGLRRRERRLRSRPAVLRRPVGARQVARHLPACRRPRAGEPRSPRSAGTPDPRDPERRGDAGLEHVEHDLRRRRDRLVRLAGDHARAGRPDHHRNARGRRRVPQARRCG